MVNLIDSKKFCKDFLTETMIEKFVEHQTQFILICFSFQIFYLSLLQSQLLT